MNATFRKLPFAIKVLCFCIGLVIFFATGSLTFLVWRSEQIHAATRRGDTQAVEEILDRHPGRIENRSRMELTPLHEAAWEGQTAVLELLIRRGANLRAEWDLAQTGEARWTALHICGISGRVEAARILLDAGADVNSRSLKGFTPLDIANRNGHTELAALLVARGGVPGSKP